MTPPSNSQSDKKAPNAPVRKGNALADRAMLDTARRTLRSQLRLPSPGMPFRWSAASLTGREIIDLNTVYPLVQGWVESNIATAESLIKSVFHLQAKDGSLAARYLPDGTPLNREAPWPLLLQAVQIVWEAGGNSAFMESLLPKLYLYADWICYYFDPSGTGLPKWKSAEESLIPEEFNPKHATPDLSILILCELEALKKIERSWPEIIEDRINFSPNMERFKKLIQEFFWNAKKTQLQTIDTDRNETIETPLYYTVLIPMSKTVSPEIRLQAKPQLVKALNNITDRELWPMRDTFQISSIYAFLIIAAAEGAGAKAECDKFNRQLWKHLASRYRHTQAIPDNLSSAINKQETFEASAPASTPCIVSSLVVHIGEQILGNSEEKSILTNVIGKLDRHPAMALYLPLALGGVAILLLTVLTIMRSEPTFARLEAAHGLATRYYKTGNYEEALSIYNQYIEKGGYIIDPQTMKAKILYRMEQYDQAADIYRSMIEKGEYHPYILLNLGLLLYRKGEFQAAIANYQKFIDDFGKDFPTAADKAKLAIKLIENHPDRQAHAEGTRTQ